MENELKSENLEDGELDVENCSTEVLQAILSILKAQREQAAKP